MMFPKAPDTLISDGSITDRTFGNVNVEIELSHRARHNPNRHSLMMIGNVTLGNISLRDRLRLRALPSSAAGSVSANLRPK